MCANGSAALFPFQEKFGKGCNPFLRQVAKVSVKMPPQDLLSNVNGLGVKTLADVGLGDTDQLFPSAVPSAVFRSQRRLQKRLPGPARHIKKKVIRILANLIRLFLPFPRLIHFHGSTSLLFSFSWNSRPSGSIQLEISVNVLKLYNKRQVK
jgi:hypothetical protein